MDITPQSNVYEWPIKLSHEFHHRRMALNLLECMEEFQEFIFTIDPDAPKDKDGSLDFNQVPFSIFAKFFFDNLQKINHTHKE